jgi:hypothetical protein
MKEYILVPANEYESYIQQSSQLNPTTQLTLPKHTKQHNIAEINVKSENILDKDLTPEINLRLYNYLQNIYRAAIKGTSTSIKQETMGDNHQKNLIKTYIKALPIGKRDLASAAFNHILDTGIAQMNKHGYLTVPGVNQKIHGIELMRTILIPNIKIDNESREFYDNILTKMPKSFIRNKHILTGGNYTSDNYWETIDM